MIVRLNGRYREALTNGDLRESLLKIIEATNVSLQYKSAINWRCVVFRIWPLAAVDFSSPGRLK
jgi:hypothetical protein